MMNDEEKKIQGLGGKKGRAEVRKSGRAEKTICEICVICGLMFF